MLMKMLTGNLTCPRADVRGTQPNESWGPPVMVGRWKHGPKLIMQWRMEEREPHVSILP